MSDERLSPAKPALPSHDSANKRAIPSDRRPDPAPKVERAPKRPKEYGGRKGPDPVRYGDWEKNGRCIDF